MFTLQKEPRWTWPVKVKVPDDKGGLTEQQFRATFRLIEAWEERGRTYDGTTTLLTEAVVELHDLVDEAGKALPHSPELLVALLRNPWIRSGLINSYVAAMNGMPISEAARGN